MICDMLLIDRKEMNEFSVLKMEKKRNAKTELDFYAVWLFFFFLRETPERLNY